MRQTDLTLAGWRRTGAGGKKLNAGRGAAGKKAVAGIKDGDTHQVTAKVIENTKKATLHKFINDHVEKGSTVDTDDFMSYRNMEGYEHQFVRHRVGEYVNEKVHINGMESFWSGLKRPHTRASSIKSATNTLTGMSPSLWVGMTTAPKIPLSR